MPLSLMCLSICLRRPHIKSTSTLNPGLQPYKYTGKELDLTHGLNTYDHGARQNYSILGVWDRVDPLAEKYYNISQYAVCGNNPIKFIDTNGDSIVAKAFGFAENTALLEAGLYQIISGTSKLDWIRFRAASTPMASPSGYIYNGYTIIIDSPFGDDPKDQYWIKEGYKF